MSLVQKGYCESCQGLRSLIVLTSSSKNNNFQLPRYIQLPVYISRFIGMRFLTRRQGERLADFALALQASFTRVVVMWLHCAKNCRRAATPTVQVYKLWGLISTPRGHISVRSRTVYFCSWPSNRVGQLLYQTLFRNHPESLALQITSFSSSSYIS